MALRPVLRNWAHRLTYRLQRLFSSKKSLRLPPKLKLADDEFRQMSFTFAVIALSAKVACCDGKLTREKYIAFRESFPLHGSVCGKIRSLFTMACDNPTPMDHYVAQIKYAFPGRTELFSTLVDRLYRIAATDGNVSREGERMLTHIAHMLEVPAGAYNAIRRRYNNLSPAHRILGVQPGVRQGTLKKRYRELMHQYHPDRYAEQQLSPEVALMLKLKASEINAAYKKLSKDAA